uniref:Solute carrier family 19 member 3b n=1 Tax=Pygocentrus nattereri TaxID=42514 RepID=A0A3B4DXP8_PYGNA
AFRGGRLVSITTTLIMWNVNNYLFPIWTYSYLSVLPVVFLLTDLLRYKPLVVLQGLFLVSNYLLLCFVHKLTAMTFLQFNYGVVTMISPEHYQRATGFIRSAMLTGFTFGPTLGQLLILLAGISYFTVKTITLGLMGTAFNKRCSLANIKVSYSSRRLVYWSVWWAFAPAHYNQVFNYVQLIWDCIEPSSTSTVYNGGVEAVCTLVSKKYRTADDLSTCTCIHSGLHMVSQPTFRSPEAHVINWFVLLFFVYVERFQIATNLSMECYALTFVDGTTLGLDIITQVNRD